MSNLLSAESMLKSAAWDVQNTAKRVIETKIDADFTNSEYDVSLHKFCIENHEKAVNRLKVLTQTFATDEETRVAYIRDLLLPSN